MRPTRRTLLAALLLAAGLAQAAEAADSLRFSRLSVTDPGMNGIEAVSLLVPAGWRAEGGIQWFPEFSVQANLLLTVSDPKTGAAVEFLPVQNFTYLTHMVVPMPRGANYLGNILWEPVPDAAPFVQRFYLPGALRHLQGGRLAGSAELPGVAQAVAQAYGGQSTVRAGRVRYEFSRDGRPWEEDVYVTLAFTPFPLGTLWGVHGAHSFRAPKGELDRLTPLLSTVVNTVRPTPQWYGGYRYVQQLFQNRMQQGIADAGNLSRRIAQNSEEIRQMFADSYRERQASQDRIARSWSEAIRGVETYRDPYAGSAVELPSGYRDVWVSRRGEYLLSNQAGFDPNAGDTTEWQRMEASGGR
jgi:hypothetical protein